MNIRNASFFICPCEIPSIHGYLSLGGSKVVGTIIVEENQTFPFLYRTRKIQHVNIFFSLAELHRFLDMVLEIGHATEEDVERIVSQARELGLPEYFTPPT